MILIFSSTLSEAMGGVEIFNSDMESLFRTNGVNYYTAKCRMFRKSKFLYSLCKVIKILLVCRRADVTGIIVQQSSFIEILLLPLLALADRPIWIISHVSRGWLHIRNRLLLWGTNKIVDTFSDKVLVLTTEQGEFFTTVKKERVSSIINKRFASQPVSTATAAPYILYFGRIVGSKGLEDLLYVYRRLRQTIDRVPRLKLVGPIEKGYEKVLPNLIKQLKLETAVDICPPIYDVVKRIELIDRAQLAVYPSHKDAFPLVVLEILARGKPCISSDVGELKYFQQCPDFLFTAKDRNELFDKLLTALQEDLREIPSAKEMFAKAQAYANGKFFEDLQRIGVLAS